MLGPHVVRALEGHHELRLTDVVDIDSAHDHLVVVVGSLEEVTEAAAGVDAIVNCSVSRRDRRLAFDVNARGCYNAMSAAVEHGVRRVVNTGPRFSLLGPSYLDHDFGLGPDVPPQSGTGLYPISKSLGQEICRVFAENHDVYVVYLIVSRFLDPGQVPVTSEDNSFSVTWGDAAEAVRCAVEVEPGRPTLPQRKVLRLFRCAPRPVRLREDRKDTWLGSPARSRCAVAQAKTVAAGCATTRS
jgi:nucleoside-diphosphate-sugar epimerase